MKTLNLPNLDESVLTALDFFVKNKPPRLNLKRFGFPIVVGSVNAYNTGVAIFSKQPAIIANESNFKQACHNYQSLIKTKKITRALIISASGEKDSIWETELAKQYGLKTTLLTCSKDSSAGKIADEVIVYRKLPEPYSYNISTYLGMFLSTTGEKAADIKKFISGLKFGKKIAEHKAYTFILPDEFAAIAPMIETKEHELFGPHVSLRAFTYGTARHAKFINVWDKELVISLSKNEYFGDKKHRLEITLPKNANIALVMALTYYIAGLIQKTKPRYFQKNIANYCLDYGYKAYGQKKPFDIIVPGN